MATPSPFPKSASHLHSCEVAPKRIYFDRSHYTSLAQQIAALSTSKTIYAGNLSFGVTADQLTAFLPGACKVVMGVNRQTKSPCGFAFVEFEYAEDCNAAIDNMDEAELLGRTIRVNPANPANVKVCIYRC